MNRILPLFFAAGCTLAVDVDRFNRGGASDAAPLDSGSPSDTSVVDAPDGSLPPDVAGDSTTPLRPRVYVAGGNEVMTNVTSVLESEVRADGTLGPWIVAPRSLPSSASTNIAVQTPSAIYILGPDYNTTDTHTVRFARIADRKIVDWSGIKSVPPHSKLAGATNGKFIYAIGGLETVSTMSVPTAKVYVAPITGTGAPGAFVATTPLPAARAAACATTVGDTLFVIAGIDASDNGQGTVYRANILADGTLDAWASITGLSSPVIGCSAVSVGNHIYVLGGYGAQDSVQHTVVSGAAISGWETSGTKMPTKHAYFQAVVVGGYVIAPGGFDSPSDKGVNVDIAPISETAIGPWKTATPLPKPRAFHTAFGIE